MVKILQSKREFRERLRALPIEEKLAMLDVLRERTLAIRASRPAPQPGAPKEPAASRVSNDGKCTETGEER